MHCTDKCGEQRDTLWAEPNGLGNPQRQGRAQTSREAVCTQILPRTLQIRALVNQCIALNLTAGNLDLGSQPTCLHATLFVMGWTSQDHFSLYERKAIQIGFNEHLYIKSLGVDGLQAQLDLGFLPCSWDLVSLFLSFCFALIQALSPSGRPWLLQAISVSGITQKERKIFFLNCSGKSSRIYSPTGTAWAITFELCRIWLEVLDGVDAPHTDHICALSPFHFQAMVISAKGGYRGDFSQKGIPQASTFPWNSQEPAQHIMTHAIVDRSEFPSNISVNEGLCCPEREQRRCSRSQDWQWLLDYLLHPPACLKSQDFLLNILE